MNTANQAPVQAAPPPETAGGAQAPQDDGGQPGEFSVGIVPKGSRAEGHQPPNLNNGSEGQQPAGSQQNQQPSQQQGNQNQAQQQGNPQDQGENAANSGQSKQDANAQAKSQRKEAATHQTLVESLKSVNDRLDQIEKGNMERAQNKSSGSEGGDAKGEGGGNEDAEKAEKEALTQLSDGLESLTSRLDRMEWERSHPEIFQDAELAKAWSAVNGDPKYANLDHDERLLHARNKAGVGSDDAHEALDSVVTQMGGTMPPSDGGGSPQTRNPQVDDDTVEVGRAFGFSQEELEEELQ